MPVLNWLGKDKIVNHHNEVPYKVLNRVYSYDKENGKRDIDNKSKNMIIHGDNLLALKSLMPKYEGMVDVIYIDPPYNTAHSTNKNQKWVYSDNVDSPIISKWLNKVVGDEGEDLSRHDKWLCMMYPRLKLLYKLLKSNGVIFIDIDENECGSLMLMCQEIFGLNNVDTIIWQKQDSRIDRNTNSKIINRFKSIHETIVICYKNKKETFFNKIYRLPEWSREQKNVDNDPRGNWQSGIISYEEGHEKEDKNSEYYYTIISPSGVKWTRHWFELKNKMNQLIQENRIYFGPEPDFKNVPRLKTFENEEKEYYMDSILRGVGTSSSAKNEIEKIFGDRNVFETPKPIKLIKECIRVAGNKKAIILDSFAGSGTTAHAVLDLNNKDGGNRQFILIEMEDYADSITAERVKRVIDGYGSGKDKVEGLNGDFSYYELGDTIIENGVLNENVDVEAIKKYIYWTETKEEYYKNEKEPYYLGTRDETSYYMFYEKDKISTLDFECIKQIKTKSKKYVIYADVLGLTNKELEMFNIIFKKIPRDIKKL